MANTAVCNDTSEATELCESYGLFLKPVAKINICAQLPQLKTPGKTISNWEVMEKIKVMIRPESFLSIKIVKSTMEFIRLEGEIENRSKLSYMIVKLDGKTIKLSGFPESLKVRAAETKVAFPVRHDWDSYFRDARNMNEMYPGERPDTMYLKDLPTRWFSKRLEKDSQSNEPKLRPSEEILKKVFETFGEIRRVDIPMLDPYRKEIMGVIAKPGTIQTFNYGQDIQFDAYVQFKEYIGFVKAMDALRGMKLMYKEDEEKAHTANIKVDFDKTRHLSEKMILKRRHERERLQALEALRQEQARLAKEEEEHRKEEERLQKLEDEKEKQRKKEEKQRLKEERRKERAVKRRLKQMEKKQKEEEARMRHKIAVEERRLLIAQRKLESLRLLSELFEEVKEDAVKEELARHEAELEEQRKQEMLEEQRRRLEEEKKKAEAKILKKLQLRQQEQELREKILKNFLAKEQQKKERQREELRLKLSGSVRLKSAVIMKNCLSDVTQTRESTEPTTTSKDSPKDDSPERDVSSSSVEEEKKAVTGVDDDDVEILDNIPEKDVSVIEILSSSDEGGGGDDGSSPSGATHISKGKPPVTRITIARGAKDYDSRRIPELAAEKARLTEADKAPVAPIRLKKLENRSAPKEIRSSFPISQVARVERHIEEKQRRLNLWDKDSDQRDKEILDLRERVALLERLNSKIENEKEEKHAKMMSLQLLMSQREAEKRELEHIVSRLEIHNSRVEEEVNSKEAKLKSLLNEINQREREKTELREEVFALKRQKMADTENKEEKEYRLKELEVEISSKERESRELRNKVISLENLTENIEKEKEEKQERLTALEDMVLKKEQEKKGLEERVFLLEARNRQIEEEKREKEEKLKKLEAQRATKEKQIENEVNGVDIDCQSQTLDKETEKKLKKLEELEAAMMRHEAEREELQQLAKSLQQRNAEMDQEKEEKQRQLRELQLAVAKKDTENYELKQKLTQLEVIRVQLQEENPLDHLDGEETVNREGLQDLSTKALPEPGKDSFTKEQSSSNDNMANGMDKLSDVSSPAHKYSSGPGSQEVSQAHTTDVPAAHSNKPARPHSPIMPPPPLSLLNPMPHISENEALRDKLRQKYLLREQEVQEKHVYLPAEKDVTPAQENDSPDAPSLQESNAPDAAPVQDAPDGTYPQEHDAPDDLPKSALPEPVPTDTDSFEALTQVTEPPDQHEDRAEMETDQQQEFQETKAPKDTKGKEQEDIDDEEETEEEVILSVTEEEISRTRQQLEQIEIEVVKKKAESAYLRKSVEDLLSMMEAADEEDGDNDLVDDDDLDNLDSEASSSDDSDEYFVEMDPMAPDFYHRQIFGNQEDLTEGVKTPSTARASPSPDDIDGVKVKLEELEHEILEKKMETERIKRTMDDLKLQKMVAAEEKKLTKHKLDDLQQSEANLKQLLAILQLRRATESEDINDDLDDDKDGQRKEARVADEEMQREIISEDDRKVLMDAIVY